MTSIINSKPDAYYMALALKQAEKAKFNDDVPVGCVIVKDDKIISRSYNQVEKRKNSLYHAEYIALNKAIRKIGEKYLTGCKIYVTLEPCAQCSGSLVLSRISELIYGTNDPKAGASGSLYEITNDSRLNHRMNIRKNVLQKECSKILKDFFNDLRKRKKRY